MGDWLIDVANSAIKTIGDTAVNVISLLPPCPFSNWENLLTSDFMSNINWVLPIGQMIFVLEAWGVSIGIYYGLSILLRWIKAVQ